MVAFRALAPQSCLTALVESKNESTVIQKNLRMPKELESTTEGEVISDRLFAETSPLWPDSTQDVPTVTIHHRLRQALFFARGVGHVLRGYDQIIPELEQGQRGLESLQKRTGQKASNRLSRLVFVTNDGAGRLYRRCDELLDRYGNRVLLCKLDVSSEELGGLLTW